jgi:hypothetical protein
MAVYGIRWHPDAIVEFKSLLKNGLQNDAADILSMIDGAGEHGIDPTNFIATSRSGRKIYKRQASKAFALFWVEAVRQPANPLPELWVVAVGTNPTAALAAADNRT